MFQTFLKSLKRPGNESLIETIHEGYQTCFETEDPPLELKYGKWNLGGYSDGFNSWNLYNNGNIIAAIANDGDDKNNIIIRDIKSKEKGMGSKLLFMLLDKGVKIETGKPGYNSISTSAYYMFKKIVKLIENNNKYKITILGKANNNGKEDMESYKESSTKNDNFHYRFEKK